MPTLKTDDGCSINYEVEGAASAPVLILSNSIGTDLRMWNDQVRAFGNRFRLVRYDRRGHGKSDAPPGPYSMERFGRDALAIADAVGAATFSWCGLSMGGMVGQWLGANAPKRLNRLIISNTNFYYPEKQPWDDRVKLVRERGMSALADPMMQRWFTPEFLARAPQKVAWVRDIFAGTPAEGFIGCAQAIRAMDFRESNPRIEVPTLVMVGAKDMATTPAMGEEITRQIKGAKLVVIPDAAHLANIEQPDFYSAAVLNFLTH